MGTGGLQSWIEYEGVYVTTMYAVLPLALLWQVDESFDKGLMQWLMQYQGAIVGLYWLSKG